MRYQNSPFTCGAVALANALEACGTNVSQDKIARLAGTNSNGTTEKGIIKACQALYHYPYPFQLRKLNEALDKVDFFLYSNSPVIVCVEKWTHWVTVIGKLGDQYIVSDGADENYIKYLSSDKLLEWWEYPYKRFYGIGIQ